MNVRTFLAVVTLLSANACALAMPGKSPEEPVPTTTRALQTTLVPTLERQLHPIATPEPTGIAVPASEDCLPQETRTQHRVTARLDFTHRTLIVQQETEYHNAVNVPLDTLVMNVAANTREDVFQLDSIRSEANHQAAETSLEGSRMTVRLPESLKPGCTVRLELIFRLRIPPIEPGSADVYQGYLGYSARQINLGHWLPAIAVRRGDDWITHEYSRIGEQEILDPADWDVTLVVENGPDGLRVAGPGIIEDSQPGQWRFRLVGGRDFSLSMSNQFKVASQRTESGTKVELYTFDDSVIVTDSGPINSGAFALDVASKSAALYSALYGAYPWERLVVVQGDFPDGMEFSGIVFVGGEYFRGFGGPTSYLMLITVHEIAHQWWYAKVGNDQALAPWLDEALATYSEYVFIEDQFPALKDWWWEFRVDRMSPQGFVDSTVYDFSSRRTYINAVYLRGVRMLDELRQELGTDAFFQWIRQYTEQGNGQIMTADDFWRLLTPEQYALTSKVRERYLQQPQVLTPQRETSGS